MITTIVITVQIIMITEDMTMEDTIMEENATHTMMEGMQDVEDMMVEVAAEEEVVEAEEATDFSVYFICFYF